MLTSQEQGNRFVRDAAIMSKPNILYAAHPLQGKAVTLSLKWEISPLWARLILHIAVWMHFPFNTREDDKSASWVPHLAGVATHNLDADSATPPQIKHLSSVTQTSPPGIYILTITSHL